MIPEPLNNFDRHRRNIEYCIERDIKQQLGDEEPNWLPNSWDMTFINMYLIKDDADGS